MLNVTENKTARASRKDQAKPESGETVAVDNATPAPQVAQGIVVEDNIPMPETSTGGGKAKYPWADLAVGQSFFVAGAKIETFYTLCSTARKKHKRVFVARKWTQGDGTQGVRVWRQADGE